MQRNRLIITKFIGPVGFVALVMTVMFGWGFVFGFFTGVGVVLGLEYYLFISYVTYGTNLPNDKKESCEDPSGDVTSPV